MWTKESTHLGLRSPGFFHPHCLFIHPLPPRIGWACHLRLSHIDKSKVHSGTWARKDNKTFILLIKIFSQTWGYSLAHSRHPIKFTEEKDTEGERKSVGSLRPWPAALSQVMTCRVENPWMAIGKAQEPLHMVCRKLAPEDDQIFLEKED